VKYSCFILLFILACNRDDQFPGTREIEISDRHFQGKVVLEKLVSRTGFKLLLKDSLNKITDQTIFQYVPYTLDTADVNHDGKTEILVGLIKPTEFDPIEKKRLFILRIDDGQLRPLWLGSRVCQELINFKTAKNGIVETLEKKKDGHYALGQYTWQGFGLTLKKYTHHELPLDKALQIFEDKM
jgi:hypothetical protein